MRLSDYFRHFGDFTVLKLSRKEVALPPPLPLSRNDSVEKVNTVWQAWDDAKQSSLWVAPGGGPNGAVAVDTKDITSSIQIPFTDQRLTAQGVLLMSPVT